MGSCLVWTLTNELTILFDQSVLEQIGPVFRLTVFIVSPARIASVSQVRRVVSVGEDLPAIHLACVGKGFEHTAAVIRPGAHFLELDLRWICVVAGHEVGQLSRPIVTPANGFAPRSNGACVEQPR